MIQMAGLLAGHHDCKVNSLFSFVRRMKTPLLPGTIFHSALMRSAAILASTKSSESVRENVPASWSETVYVQIIECHLARYRRSKNQCWNFGAVYRRGQGSSITDVAQDGRLHDQVAVQGCSGVFRLRARKGESQLNFLKCRSGSSAYSNAFIHPYRAGD